MRRIRRRTLLLISLALLALGALAVAFLRLAWRNEPVFVDVVWCRILSTQGEPLRTYPGTICLFLDDGSFLSFDKDQVSLSRISATGRVLWRRQPLYVHHKLQLNPDGNEILLLSYDSVRQGDREIVYPSFLVLDLDGNTLRSWKAVEHEEEIDRAAPIKGYKFVEKKRDENGDQLSQYEFSHANSLIEIPPGPLAARSEAFQPGNYLIGLNGKGLVAVLDRRMKRILWTRNLGFRDFHDAQILADGSLLLYQNSHDGFGKRLPGDLSHNRLLRMDPLSGEILWQYVASPPQSFSATMNGGVQALPEGGYLFSQSTERFGGFVIHLGPDGRERARYPLPVHDPATKKPLRFQEVKRMDLSAFLRKNLY